MERLSNKRLSNKRLSNKKLSNKKLNRKKIKKNDDKLHLQCKKSNKKRKIQKSNEFCVSFSSKKLTKNSKEEFYNLLKDDLNTYCICLKTFSYSLKPFTWCLKAYLEFKDSLYTKNVRKIITKHYPNYNIGVKVCLNKKMCLKNISEWDKDPIFNCLPNELSFTFQALQWVKATPVFVPTDKFVIENIDSITFLQRAHATYYKHTFLLRPVTQTWDNWTLKVSVWWNQCYNTFDRKNKSLYLWGDSQHGKKHVIHNIIETTNLPYVFKASNDKYFMEHYFSEIHKIILFENFFYDKSIIKMLKCLVKHKSFTYNNREGCPQTIVHNGPIIFISDYNFSDYLELTSYLYFVHANKPYFDGDFIELKNLDNESIAREITATDYNLKEKEGTNNE